MCKSLYIYYKFADSYFFKSATGLLKENRSLIGFCDNYILLLSLQSYSLLNK